MHSALPMQCFVSVIPFSKSVHESQESPDELAQRARKKLRLYRDFGQCPGENWSPVQEYDSNKLAGMQYNNGNRVSGNMYSSKLDLFNISSKFA